MKLLIYSSQGTHLDAFLQAGIHLPPDGQMEVTTRFSDFEKKIQSCLSGQSIVVCLVGSEDDIAHLRFVLMNLSDTKLIIGLLNDDQDLFSSALTLYPRFVGTLENNCQNLMAVLNKMLENKLWENNKQKVTIAGAAI